MKCRKLKRQDCVKLSLDDGCTHQQRVTIVLKITENTILKNASGMIESQPADSSPPDFSTVLL